MIISLTLLGGYVGSRPAEEQTEANLRAHYTPTHIVKNAAGKWIEGAEPQGDY